MKSINPFTGKEIKDHRELSDDELVRKLRLSNEFFKKYREVDFSVKSELLRKTADLLTKNSESYAGTITMEMGKPISESIAEVKKCAWVCSYYADNAEQFLERKEIKTEALSSFVIYQPLGPILAVMPWNFPFWQVFRFAAPALMAGNTVLLKHASNVQMCAKTIEEIFMEAGFESGAFQNLAISSGRVKEIIENPVIKGVTLTGSEEAGSSVASIAGKNLKKTVLELGGNNAFIVLKGADLNQAAHTAITARLLNAGQSCIAAKRFIIEKDVVDEFTGLLINRLESQLVDDPIKKETKMGPLSSLFQAEAVRIQVKKSVELGAVSVFSGRDIDCIMDPIILRNVKPGMPAFNEEVFGPVFAIIVADNYKHALALANDSEFGLGINVFTNSQEKADFFIRNAEEGAVFVNEMVKSDPRLPFGGIKKSGYGRELSIEGIKEFVNTKTVYIKNI